MTTVSQPPVNVVSKGAIACKWMLIDPAHDVWILGNAGAPTNGTSGSATWAGTSSLLLDFTNGVLYINTSATKGSPTWTKVGTQS